MTTTKLLLVVDPGVSPLEAVRHVAAGARTCAMAVHLAQLVRPLPRWPARFTPAALRRERAREQGLEALEPAARVLAEAGIAFRRQVLLCSGVRALADYAEREGYCRIVYAAAGRGTMLRRLLPSAAARFADSTRLPVEVIEGPVAAGGLERYGVPAGLSLALLVVATD